MTLGALANINGRLFSSVVLISCKGATNLRPYPLRPEWCLLQCTYREDRVEAKITSRDLTAKLLEIDAASKQRRE